MSWATGTAAHILDGAIQKPGKLFLFLRGEALDDAFFIFHDGIVHQFLAFPAFGQDIDPFAAAVIGVCAKFDEAFLFQTGQKSGDGGMAELKFLLQIPGTGRGLGVGQKAHDPSLGGGKLHLFQRVAHGLVGTPVQDPRKVSIVVLQKDHLLNKNVARYLSF